MVDFCKLGDAWSPQDLPVPLSFSFLQVQSFINIICKVVDHNINVITVTIVVLVIIVIIIIILVVIINFLMISDAPLGGC